MVIVWDVSEGHYSRDLNEASLMVQWLRICPPVQRTQVRYLVQEDSICHKATKPTSRATQPVCQSHKLCHSACVPEPMSCATQPVCQSHKLHHSACVPRLPETSVLEPVACKQRSLHSKKPTHCSWRVAPTRQN